MQFPVANQNLISYDSLKILTSAAIYFLNINTLIVTSYRKLEYKGTIGINFWIKWLIFNS